MKDILRSLMNYPLYLVLGVAFTSIVFKRNIFADEILSFSLCFAALWTISYLMLRHKKKKAEAGKTAGLVNGRHR